ncbi:MAG TPA: PAS domain S-box protein [Dehalococcoidales bacterium]|nr:PAS domain S-box protein [Dehalococcoidales bacterium]
MKGKKPARKEDQPVLSDRQASILTSSQTDFSNFAALTLPVIILDNSLAVSFVNKAFTRLSGFSRKELTGLKPPFPFWPENRADAYLKALKNGTDRPRPANMLTRSLKEIRVIVRTIRLNKDQSNELAQIWVDVTGLLSQQKTLERALKISRYKFYKLFNAVPVPLAINTFPGFEFVEVNRAFLKTAGLKREEVIGLTTEQLDWRDRAEAFKIEDTLKNQGKITNQEIHLLTAGGKIHTAIYNASKINLGGEDYVLSASMDISQRKQIEEALRESEVFNASLLEHVPNPVLVVNPDFTIRYVNPAFERLTGYTYKEVVGMEQPYPWWVPFDVDSPEHKKPVPRELEVTGAEKLLRKKDGEQFWISLSLRHIREEGELKYVLGIWMDITMRKKMEEAVKESEAFNASLLEHAPNPVLVVNPDYSVRYVNPAFEQLTGFSSREVVGLKPPYPWWLLKEDGSPQFNHPVPREREVTGVENRVQKKNGEIFWISLSLRQAREQGRLLYFIGNWVDITALKKAEETLKESEAFNASLLNDAPNPVMVFNLDRSVRYVNTAMLDFTGFSREELLGSRPPYPWWPPLFIDSYTAVDAEIVTEKTNLERLIITRKGETRWIALSLRTVRRDGQAKFHLANWVDITARKAMEERITELYQHEKTQREELQEEARSRGLFINVLAHELRTPVTPVLASTAVLNDIYENRPETLDKKLVANILNSTQTLARRLEELLDLARYARGTFKLDLTPTDLNDFFKEVLTRFKPTLQQRNQQLIIRLPQDLPVAEVDPSRLEQVISNLLANSSKFSPEKSSINFSVDVKNQELRVEVKDEGIGISEEGQKRLFQPYHRVEQDRQQFTGLGLGLAVSKHIVVAHGGKIWVESILNKGSTFVFTIPLKLCLT